MSEATAISNTGPAVGYSMTAAGGVKATAWSDGRLVVLPSWNHLSSHARTVNDAGWIVGFSAVSAVESGRAVLWFEGALHDLNTLVVNAGAEVLLVDAAGINAHGQIVGRASIGTGSERAFLLTPLHPADIDANGLVDGADLNGDGMVDGADLGVLLAAWGG